MSDAELAGPDGTRFGWAERVGAGLPIAAGLHGTGFPVTRFANTSATIGRTWVSTWDALAKRSTTPSPRSSLTCAAHCVGSGSVLGSDALPSRRAWLVARRVAGWLVVAVIAVAIT